ncbi:hypothetical protein ACNTMW_00835 [Planosporangium sp. 12N6]|uniref:hypothetical protein n=1 Tax=Planosporangium spinosum TaxID=3402278 RepID=UPI003CFACCD6
MKIDHDDALSRVRERIENHTRDHWHEFAIIVASANTLLALTLFGRIFVRGHADRIGYLSIGIAIASTTAAILAYYSIQIGSILLFGPLHLPGVLVSFLIAAAQLALFLWPTHVLGTQWPSALAELKSLRHWLLCYAIFALAAPLASWHAATVRKREVPKLVVKAYETGQRIDRKSACVAGMVVCLCWALSFRLLLPAVIFGIAAAVISSIMGIASQTRVAKRFLHDFDDSRVSEQPASPRR